ncbi:MAG: hypothetical protein JNM57_16440 [Cyclobacteriaceae bacterium]|nr:hypothetical protein [Cyclobacteriaceae bacterium]
METFKVYKGQQFFANNAKAGYIFLTNGVNGGHFMWLLPIAPACWFSTLLLAPP